MSIKFQYKCTKPCARFNKGCTTNKESHRCPNFCYDQCPPCLIEVRKFRTVCDHVFDVPCNVDVDTITCTKPCKRALPCGHKCKTTCNEECSKCKELVSISQKTCKYIILCWSINLKCRNLIWVILNSYIFIMLWSVQSEIKSYRIAKLVIEWLRFNNIIL